MTPRIVGVLFRGMVCPFMVSLGCFEDSCRSGVSKVTEDFGAETFILFCVSQASREFRYVWTLRAAVMYLECCPSIVTSSA